MPLLSGYCVRDRIHVGIDVGIDVRMNNRVQSRCSATVAHCSANTNMIAAATVEHLFDHSKKEEGK